MTDRRDKIRDRIAKLLRLAESSNEHEAANAAEKAAELMLEYELEVSVDADGEVVDPNEITEWTLEFARERVIWRGLCAQAAAETCGCQMYFRGKDIQIVGLPSKRDAVETMFLYLVDTLTQAVEAEARRRDDGDYWVHKFLQAAAEEIDRRMGGSRRERLAVERERIERLRDQMRQGGAGLGAGEQGKSNKLEKLENVDLAIERYMQRLGIELIPRTPANVGDAADAGASFGASVTVGQGGGARRLKP